MRNHVVHHILSWCLLHYAGVCKTIFDININSWALAEKRLAWRSRPVSATEDEAVVCHLCSGVSGGWSAVFKESRSVGPGLRRMEETDVWCCSLQTGWMISVCVDRRGSVQEEAWQDHFFKSLLFRQWSPVAVIYQPVVQLLSKPWWVHSILPMNVSFTFLCVVYVWFCAASSS